MRFLRLLLPKKRMRPERKSALTCKTQKHLSPLKTLEDENFRKIDLGNTFSKHISKYTGQTVTIFTAGGGISGRGFTGVLLSANDIYVRLLSCVGPAPAYNPGNQYDLHHICSYSCAPWVCGIVPDIRFLVAIDSFTYIPINKITSFLHNSL